MMTTMTKTTRRRYRPRRPAMSTVRGAALAIGTAVLSLAPLPLAAQDALIEGCSVVEVGELGVGGLAGDVGQYVDVPVYIHTSDEVDAIQVEVAFPTGVLSYVHTQPGVLTAGFTNLGGNFVGGRVRVAGLTIGAPIPPATEGTIAIVRFEVNAAGSGFFDMPESFYAGDLGGYAFCDSSNASPVEPDTWGCVKGRYR